MTASFLLFTLAGLALFYLENLVLLPQVRLRLVELLIFYVGLRPAFPVAFWVAVVLGFLEDSYAVTPFGLHLATNLLLVAAARFCRRQLILGRRGPQFLAPLVALLLQEAAWLALLPMVGVSANLSGGVLGRRMIEIVCTAALGPLMAALMRFMEKILGRYGLAPKGGTSSLS
jgi:rod shape-determining protein MreD